MKKIYKVTKRKMGFLVGWQSTMPKVGLRKTNVNVLVGHPATPLLGRSLMYSHWKHYFYFKIYSCHPTFSVDSVNQGKMFIYIVICG